VMTLNAPIPAPPALTDSTICWVLTSGIHASGVMDSRLLAIGSGR
jgi:hypothetical protein